MKRAWSLVLIIGTAACGAVLGLPDRVDDPELSLVADASSVDSPAIDDVATEPSSAPHPLTKIVVSPPTATVLGGKTQQFTATATDAMGNAPAPAPTYAWSVSGGGTVDGTGLFTAGMTGGGPFTVTATTGPVTGTASVSVMTTPFTIGETKILTSDDSGNANYLLAQEATLEKTATLRSLSLYISVAAGKLRLGIYDASGPAGGPGTKKAETNEFTAVVGWNTANVTSPVSLPAGKVWLAFAPNDSNMHFPVANDGTGRLAYYPQTYGPMPATYSTTPSFLQNHWSLYATLTP